MRMRRQRSSAQGGAPATTTLGRNRVIGTGVSARGGQPVAEFAERAGAGEQQRVAVGEADDVPVPPVLRVDRPPGRVVQVDQPHRAAEIGREPGVGLRPRRGGQQRGAPDASPSAAAAPAGGSAMAKAVRPSADTWMPPGPQVTTTRASEGSSRWLMKRPSRVDQEPPAVPGQAPRLDEGLVEVHGAGRLHRVDVDRGEAHTSDGNKCSLRPRTRPVETSETSADRDNPEAPITRSRPSPSMTRAVGTRAGPSPEGT